MSKSNRFDEIWAVVTRELDAIRQSGQESELVEDAIKFESRLNEICVKLGCIPDPHND